MEACEGGGTPERPGQRPTTGGVSVNTKSVNLLEPSGNKSSD